MTNRKEAPHAEFVERLQGPLSKPDVQNAWGELYKRTVGPLVIYARGIGAPDPQAVVQDVYLRVLRQRERLNPEADPVGLLRASVRHEVIDNNRKDRRRPRRDDGRRYPEDISPDVFPPAPSAEDLVIRRREEEELVRRLTQVGLNSHQLTVIYLRFFEGLQVREIADELGIPRDTARSRLYNGLKKVKDSGLFGYLQNMIM